MGKAEIASVIAAIIVLCAITAFSFVLKNQLEEIPLLIFMCILIVCVAVFSKKVMASFLDADVEHSIWNWERYGFRAHHHLEKEIPMGIILPLFISIFSLGAAIVPTSLTYEACALKRRAARRFGNYSYTELTDFHNAIIGAAGTIGVLILAVVFYFSQARLEYYATLASVYALFNLVPVAKLDGAQIFYGSRVLWTTLVVIAAVFVLFATFIALHVL
jgi:Zn-dependent protease